MNILKNNWQNYLNAEFDKSYYQTLHDFLKKEYESQTIYPNMYDIFNALHYTDFNDVKVVILGQDPYHGPNQAHGLSFSVQKGIQLPPSLRNIYKELDSDLKIPPASHGDLTAWAKQGVLLLNTVLTVRQGAAHSHRGHGWEIFTDQVIRSLNEKETPVVYILWGRAAQNKKALIDLDKHFTLESVHPSPLSAHRGFFGSKPFSKTNAFLKESGQPAVDWRL